MGVINQIVVYINDPFLKINITPTKTGQFAYAKSGSERNRKQRIPVRIGSALLQKIQEKLLLLHCKPSALLSFKAARLLQLPQHVVRRIAANVIIINGHFDYSYAAEPPVRKLESHQSGD